MTIEPNELHLRRRSKIQEDKDFTSARISETARYVAFGLTAVTLTLLTSESDFAKEVLATDKKFVIVAAAFGCVVILADYFHYLAGYKSSEIASHNAAGDYAYDTHSPFYKARRFLFYFKQIVAVTGALLFIAVLLRSLWN